MPNRRITIKRGDTGIALRATLSNEEGNVDITNARVLFLMDGHELVASIEDGVNGVVSVTFNRTHTENTGFYMAEFEVQFKDGRVETYPNQSYISIRIQQDLGGVN